MTHVKNAERFARLVDFCTGYGGMYNPGRQTLQIQSLLDTKSKATDSLNKVIVAKAHYDNLVNYRKQMFDQMQPLAARVMRILEASGASKEKLADARAYVQRINGTTKKLTAAASSATVGDETSSSGGTAKRLRTQKQMSYVSRTDAFAKLVSAVSTEPLYLANEAGLCVDGLKNMLESLSAANAQVSMAQVAWSNALIDRNNVLYQQDQSVYRTGLAVKKYVRALYGLNSEQYAQVKAVVFTKSK
jgi:hypothetical protein